MDTVVMKFGGASATTPQHFALLADLVLTQSKTCANIVIVISAMGTTTDELIALAKEVNPDPPKREYDMLVTVGERISIALLAMALARKGLQAISFTGSQSGIITTSDHSEARIVDVRPRRIEEALEAGKVAIVAGFQGVSTDREITTLGRGGSDTTAVALGIALGAERVEFYKDVPGIFDEDPKKNPCSRMHDRLTYHEALELVQDGHGVLDPRSIVLAQKNNLPLVVRSFSQTEHGTPPGTRIDGTSMGRQHQPQYEQAAFAASTM